MASIVVSDIHGNRAAIKALARYCARKAFDGLPLRTIVFLGDTTDHWAMGDAAAREFMEWSLAHIERCARVVKEIVVVSGNHDAEVLFYGNELRFRGKPIRVVDSLEINGDVFIHGHQADNATYNETTSRWLRFLTRIYAKYLEIRFPELQHIAEEISMAIVNRRKHINERKKYRDFAKQVAIVKKCKRIFTGHTHSLYACNFVSGAVKTIEYLGNGSVSVGWDVGAGSEVSWFDSGFGREMQCTIINGDMAYLTNFGVF